jgi:hypothetical protein
VRTDLKAAGIDPAPEVVDGLLTEAAEHAERVALEQRERRMLSKLKRPTYELPVLAEGVDLGALYSLAEVLRSQGAA